MQNKSDEISSLLGDDTSSLLDFDIDPYFDHDDKHSSDDLVDTQPLDKKPKNNRHFLQQTQAKEFNTLFDRTIKQNATIQQLNEAINEQLAEKESLKHELEALYSFNTTMSALTVPGNRRKYNVILNQLIERAFSHDAHITKLYELSSDADALLSQEIDEHIQTCHQQASILHTADAKHYFLYRTVQAEQKNALIRALSSQQELISFLKQKLSFLSNQSGIFKRLIDCKKNLTSIKLKKCVINDAKLYGTNGMQPELQACMASQSSQSHHTPHQNSAVAHNETLRNLKKRSLFAFQDGTSSHHAEERVKRRALRSPNSIVAKDSLIPSKDMMHRMDVAVQNLFTLFSDEPELGQEFQALFDVTSNDSTQTTTNITGFLPIEPHTGKNALQEPLYTYGNEDDEDLLTMSPFQL